MRLYADNGDNLAPIDRVLPKLQRVKQGSAGWSAQCPAHEDKHPSLTVAIGDDGRVLLNCHKGCSYGEVMTALGLAEADGFPPDAPIAFVPPSHRHIVATYDYHDEQHQTLFQTVRYSPKDFRQRHSNGNGEWVWNLGGVRRVLYRLPEIQQADPNLMVWLVEGEKDADYLTNLGFIATTSPMGANNWKPEYAEFLRGRHVVIVPDNDGAGAQYAAAAMQSLHDVAASTRVILLPGIGPKQDVSDWLDAGHSAEELAALAQAAPETIEVPVIEEEAEAPRYTLHWLAEAFEEDTPVDWVVNGLFQRGSISLLHGAPGTKKTYTLLDLAMCLVEGKQWLGRDTTKGTVLLIDEESGPKRLKRRMREVAHGHETPSTAKIAYTTLEMFNLRTSSHDLEHIDGLMADIAPTLVIVDALADIMPGGDENEVKDTHPVFQNLKYLAHRHNCCIIVIHHSNRSGGYRGSSAIPGVVDVMIKLESKPHTTELAFTIEKNRDGEEDNFNAEIVFDHEKASVTLVAKETVAEIAKNFERPSVQHVLGYLTDVGGGAFVDDIIATPSICSTAAARAAIYRLAQEGRIIRVDKGARGSRAYYKLSDPILKL